MVKITTVKEIEEKNKETFEDIKKKELLKKLSPEELIVRRTQIEEMEIQILDKKKMINLLEGEIAEELPMRRKRLQLRKEQNELSKVEFDLQTIKRMVKQSERS